MYRILVLCLGLLLLCLGLRVAAALWRWIGSLCIYLGPDWDPWGHMEPCWQGPQGPCGCPMGLQGTPGAPQGSTVLHRPKTSIFLRFFKG